MVSFWLHFSAVFAIISSLKTEEMPLKNITEFQEENELLKNQIAALIQSVTSLEKEHSALKDQALLLTEQVEWFKRHIFGSKSERVVPGANQQMDFFHLADGDNKSEETPFSETPAQSMQHLIKKRLAL